MKIALLINGLALNKADLKKTLMSIENDMHIKYAREYFYNEFSNQAILNNADEMLPIVDLLMEMLFDMKFPLLGEIGKIAKSKLEHNLATYIRQSDPHKKHNFNYWNLFLSNLSDSQLLLAAHNNLKGYSTIKQIFCDMPYYINRYIDSINIAFLKDNNNVSIENIKKLINNHIIMIMCRDAVNKLLEESEIKTYLKQFHYGEKISKAVQDFYASRGLFGIWFLSSLLFKLYDDKHMFFEYSEMLIERINNRLKFKKSKDVSFDGPFLRECILFGGNPGKMHFYGGGEGRTAKKTNYPEEWKDDFTKNRVKLLSINYTRSQGKTDTGNSLVSDNFEDIFNLHEDGSYVYVTIPIKRIISLPLHYYEQMISLDFIPSEPEDYEKYLSPFPASIGSEIDFFCIGGGEHNNPLIHLVNIMRYRNKNDRRLGFIENVYDRKLKSQTNHMKPDFLICLDNFVSGINEISRTRIEFESFNNEAEILRIDFKKDAIQGYSIYGFSAPMTRYAFLGLLMALNKDENRDIFKKFANPEKNKYEIDEYTNFTRSKALNYFVGENLDEFKEMRDFFDIEDIMNNTHSNRLKNCLIENLYLYPTK